MRQVYPEKGKEILSAKLDALAKTNMVDFAKEIYTNLHGTDAPKGSILIVETRSKFVEPVWDIVWSDPVLFSFCALAFCCLQFSFVSVEMDEKRDRVIAELQRLQEEAAPAIELVEADAVKQMRENKQLTLANVQSQFSVRS